MDVRSNGRRPDVQTLSEKNGRKEKKNAAVNDHLTQTDRVSDIDPLGIDALRTSIKPIWYSATRTGGMVFGNSYIRVESCPCNSDGGKGRIMSINNQPLSSRGRGGEKRR